MHGKNRGRKAQASLELLITLSFGIAILLPLVIVAFVQLANSNSALSSIESQEAASKLSSVATLIGSEGPPAKQLVQIEMPPGVEYLYVGSINNSIGHEIIFVIRSANGPSYITSYTPVNVSGNLGGIVNQGTYLVNISAQQSCPSNQNAACVYMAPTG